MSNLPLKTINHYYVDTTLQMDTIEGHYLNPRVNCGFVNLHVVPPADDA